MSEDHSLLALPQGIRDIILQYVFACEDGIVVFLQTDLPELQIFAPAGQQWTAFKHGSRSIRQHSSLQVLPNPLKLVCRALREQTTRRLVFQANDRITLHGTSFVTPSSYTLQSCAQHIGVAALKGLRKVDIHGAPIATGTQPEPLTWQDVTSYQAGFQKFCNENSHVQVILRFRRVANVQNISWLGTTVLLREIIRSESITAIPEKYRVTREVQKAVAGAATTVVPHLRMAPANLRFSLMFDAFPMGMIDQWSMSLPVGKDEMLSAAAALWEDGI